MITSIIFSKDRALQLDLTLESIKQNFPICNKIKVIYKTSGHSHNISYRKLRNTHSDVYFDDQGDGELLLTIISAIKNENNDICFFTDDNIFYRKSKSTEADISNLLNDNCCVSLRLGVNITHRDFGNGLEPDAKPQLFKDGANHIVWNRMSVPAGGYWNYPLSVDGHIFKISAIKSILHTIAFWPEAAMIITPNKFEQILQRFFFEIPATMASEVYSCVINSPNNRVQDEILNKHGEKFFCDADTLNFLFSEGKRLNLDKIDFGQICSPHQELDIIKALI